MKDSSRPLPLKDAPLQYAPDSEMGVVFLFATVAKKLQYRIETIREAYPDCIAYKHVGNSESESNLSTVPAVSKSTAMMQASAIALFAGITIARQFHRASK